MFRALLLLAVLAVLSLPSQAEGMSVPALVLSVHDGDTIMVDAKPWPGITVRVKVRVMGLDAPELKVGATTALQIRPLPDFLRIVAD